jgi:hypothetical protein
MKKARLLIFLLIFGLNASSQNTNQLIGVWKLEKISYKKVSATNVDGKEEFLIVLKAGLYKQLRDEQKLDAYELEQLNIKATELLKLFYQSQIEFEGNRGFLNRSKMLEQPTSGEYLRYGNELLMEWETADKFTYKILKINASELVLKDETLKLAYYYTKTKTEKL